MTQYLVIPVEAENTGRSELGFGPSAFRVRDWFKSQFAPSVPPVNSTAKDCVDYYHNSAGLAQQSLMSGSRMAGEVWVDIGSSGANTYPWEIYVDVPGGEQVLFKIAVS